MWALRVFMLVLVIALAGCKTKTVYVPVERRTIHIQTMRDTVIGVPLAQFHDSVIVPADSTSYLANPYGYSTAEVKDGKLHHSLDTWPDKTIDVPLQYPHEQTIDSVPKPYPVDVIREVEKSLTWWQKARIALGEALLYLTGGAVLFGIGRKKLF